MSDTAVVKLKRRGTRPRGEQTRRKILDATLRVIGRDGVSGTTHRAIAREAGVQLSLTTYYFKDLNELLSLAFRSFMDRDYGEMTEQWKRAFRYLDQFSADDLARDETRQRIIDYCTKRVVDLCQRLDTKPRVLFASSCYVYAPVTPDNPVVAEDAPTLLIGKTLG